MSSKQAYGRSSLSFNAPKGILDIDDIVESNPWKDMKTFDHGEAGQIQRVLTEFGDMLSQQRQRRERSGAVKKNDQKKKTAVKSEESAKVKANDSGIERRSRKVGDSSHQKVGSDEGKSKQVETRRSLTRKSKNSPKKNEDYSGVPIKRAKKEPENIGNEEKPAVGEKKIVTRRSLMAVEKGINVTKAKKSDDVQTGDEQSKAKGTVDNVMKKKSRIGGTDVKKTLKRPRKTSEKTVAGITGVKSESKVTKNLSLNRSNVRAKSDVDKENEKPPVKKLQTNPSSRGRKSEVGSRRSAQRDKPLAATRSSFGKNRISPKSKESSSRLEESSKVSPEKSTKIESNSVKSSDSLEKSLEKSGQSIEPTAERTNENVDEAVVMQEKSAESFSSLAEETRAIGQGTPKANSTVKETKNEPGVEELSISRYAACSDNSATASQLQLSKCASSSAMFYDSAISSFSQRNRKPRVSIVAKVTSDVDATLPPLELKYTVDLTECKKGGKLRPNISMKTPRNFSGISANSSRISDQSRSQGKIPENAQKQHNKCKHRKSYQQKLEERREQREKKRDLRHKRKVALAVKEFSRQVLKVAKRIGYLSGDSGSATAPSSSTTTTSSSPSSMDSRDSSSTDSSDLSDLSSSSTYTSSLSSSDTNFCSCTTCMLSDFYESSSDWTEFSPYSTTSSSFGSSSSSTDDSEPNEA